jgi:phosphoribosyl-ATP pyrophosphohydrolase
MPFTLETLANIIAQRATVSVDASYTARLLASGTAKCAQKVGEEAVEVVIEAVKEDAEKLTLETADLLYHLLVVLHQQGVPLTAVYQELEKRHKQ